MTPHTKGIPSTVPNKPIIGEIVMTVLNAGR